LSKLVHVQVLRALAALSVAMLHAQFDAGAIAERTGRDFRPSGAFPWAAGVEVFFVISGFIMVYASRRLFGAPHGRRTFLAHRVARVVPLYWAVTTLYLVVALAAPAFLNRDYLAPGYVLASYLFIPVERPDGLVQPLYGLGWTLNYEMYFYVLFAAALGWRRTIAVPALTAGFLVLVALGRLMALPEPLAFWTDPIILEFAFGMALGMLRERGVRLGGAAALALATAALALLVLDFGRSDAAIVLPRVLAYGVPAALLVAAAALRPLEPERTDPLTRIAVALGDASYALYLLHPFVIRAAREAMLDSGLAAAIGPWGFVALALVLASAAALLAHRLFERPLTAWTRRRLEGRPASLPRRGALDYADPGAGSPARADTDTRASP
jgi:exopolysaccharide production protein ExoZ